MTANNSDTPRPRAARSKKGLGLVSKLLGATVLVVVLVSVALSWRASAQLEAQLTSSFESKGEAMALALSSAAEQAGESDAATVQGSIDADKLIRGVKYIFLVDSRGRPYVHTFTPKFPDGLAQQNPLAIGEDLAGKRVKIRHGVSYPGASGIVRAIDVLAPIGGGALGAVHIGMDQGFIDNAVAELQTSMFLWGGGIGLLGILLSAGVTLLVVIRPIRELTLATSAIVDEGDLAQQIHVRSNDEIGELAATFRKMVEQLRAIPKEIEESTQLLARSVSVMGSSAREQSKTMVRQAAALQETRVTAQSIHETSLLAAQKADAVLVYAERADAIGRSGEEAVAHSVEALNDIRERVGEIAERITNLAERTAQIADVTQTVKDLADQSNMLALNAAIEAVRSGEHGKGFAVVAREIRTLADQSIEATRRAREILGDISSAARVTVQITEKGAQRIDLGLAQVKTSGDKLAELSAIVKENASAVRQINAAVGQQNAGVAQIFGALNDQTEMMGETMKGLEATDSAVASLTEVSGRLVHVVGRFRI